MTSLKRNSSLIIIFCPALLIHWILGEVLVHPPNSTHAEISLFSETRACMLTYLLATLVDLPIRPSLRLDLTSILGRG